MSTALKLCPQCGTEYPANARFCEIDGTALRSGAGSEDMVGSIVADRYHVMKKLGEGGMGQVYLVEHVKMGRKSALKVMHPGMVKDVDAISRFNREAANASRISHPNVASVYDFGETADGIIYLAMEFVDGPPLTSVIEQAGALAPKRAAEIVRQTAEALAVAHDMGIVHRDLKPDNIMIGRTRDGGDMVKVVDFGIAKAAGNEAQKVTKTGLVVGTPEYMSPEQLAGDKLDGRSDIYALGLVAFNMLTGTLPFPSDSAQESMIMRLTDRPKTLQEMRPEVLWPAEVQAVLDHALERDAALRYQNATEFGRDLVRTVDRMSQTVASDMSTQAMSAAAVPPTRIPGAEASSAPGMPGAMKTMAVPSAPQGAAPPAAPAAPVGAPVSAPPAKKSMLIPVAGGIGLVAVLGVAGYFAMSGKPKAADTTTGKLPQSAVSPRETTTTAAGSGPTSPPAPPSTIPSTGGPTRPTSSGTPVNTGVASSPEDQLRALIDDSKDPTKSANVLAMVTRLAPQATSSEGIYLAASLKSRVAAVHGDTAKACRELTAVYTRVAKNEQEQIDNRKGPGALECP